jgi:uncharacterized SAM-binding protein YcdF (DUF218 family)
VIGCTLLAVALSLGLIVRSDDDVGHADVIFVFSGSAAYVERTQRAAQLFQKGRAPLILLTDDGERGGWSSAEQRNPFFVERAINELRNAGVPANKIVVLPGTVSSTYEEAQRLRSFISEHDLHSVLAVTSAYHSRRASWTLHRVIAPNNIRIAFSAPPPGVQTPGAATWWLTPQGWRLVTGEYLKLMYYWWEYR